MYYKNGEIYPDLGEYTNFDQVRSNEPKKGWLNSQGIEQFGVIMPDRTPHISSPIRNNHVWLAYMLSRD
jgi:hypothetical protein